MKDVKNRVTTVRQARVLLKVFRNDAYSSGGSVLHMVWDSTGAIRMMVPRWISVEVDRQVANKSHTWALHSTSGDCIRWARQDEESERDSGVGAQWDKYFSSWQGGNIIAPAHPSPEEVWSGAGWAGTNLPLSRWGQQIPSPTMTLSPCENLGSVRGTM